MEKEKLKPGPKAHHVMPERFIKFRFDQTEHNRVMDSLPADTRERGELLLSVIAAAESGEALSVSIVNGRVVVNAAE